MQWNLLETGEVGEGRHFAIWQDPTKKPSYLFACVIGDFSGTERSLYHV
ncbi:MAG: hypothetical protein U1E88_03635 [Acinetobacter sp.]